MRAKAGVLHIAIREIRKDWVFTIYLSLTLRKVNISMSPSFPFCFLRLLNVLSPPTSWLPSSTESGKVVSTFLYTIPFSCSPFLSVENAHAGLHSPLKPHLPGLVVLPLGGFGDSSRSILACYHVSNLTLRTAARHLIFTNAHDTSESHMAGKKLCLSLVSAKAHHKAPCCPVTA